MKIIYISGKLNAERLSRPVCAHSDEHTCNICVVSVEIPTISAEGLKQKQVEDPNDSVIINGLEGDSTSETTKWSERRYILNNIVLYLHYPYLDTEELQLVIPVSVKEKMLRQYYDTDRRTRVDQTFQNVTKYFISGIRQYIAQHVIRCIDCQRFKINNLKNAGLLQTPAPSQSFETIAVDLLGPLPDMPRNDRYRSNQ